MRSTKSLLLCSLVVVFTIICSIASLKLDFHIESLCKFSSRLIETQFGPSYQLIKDRADIDYFIYGKSETIIAENGSISFICQHGDWECEKNINMTCVLTFLGSNVDLKTKFVICAMDFNRSYPVLDPGCLQEVGIEQRLVDECVLSGQGRILQKNIGLLSEPYISLSDRVPTIVFNGIYNQLVSGIAQDGFLDTFRGVENGTFKLTSST